MNLIENSKSVLFSDYPMEKNPDNIIAVLMALVFSKINNN
jgi:hypothetical protein